jgi:hypothetical protein
LTNIRVVYSGLTVLHEKNSETMLAGKRLPLDKKVAAAFLGEWETYLSVFDGNEIAVFPGKEKAFNPGLEKAQILNFIESNLDLITD